jgi:hypothetical protein
MPGRRVFSIDRGRFSQNIRSQSASLIIEDRSPKKDKEKEEVSF